MKMIIQQLPESDAACSLLSLVNAANLIDPNQGDNKNNEMQRPTTTTPCESPVHLMSDNHSVSSDLCATSEVLCDLSPTIMIYEKTGPKVQFPMVLMSLLDEPSNSDVATFLPDGKSFAILRPEAFAMELLPRCFKMTKFSSFVRKLYRWGFRQTKSRGKSGSVSYYHPLFRRGDLSLCQKIKCQKSADKPSSLISSASSQCQPVIPMMRPVASCQSDQCMQQEEASPTRMQPLSPASQRPVDDATKTVLEAAFEVLNKDGALPPTTTMDLDQMTRRLLGSSRLGRRPGMLNGGLPMRSNILLGRPVVDSSGLVGLTVGRSIVPGRLNNFQLKK